MLGTIHCCLKLKRTKQFTAYVNYVLLLIVVPDLPPPPPELVEKPPPIIPATTPATNSTVKPTTGNVMFFIGITLHVHTD